MSGSDDFDKTPIFLHPRIKLQMFIAGQKIFNEEDYYDAHEEWEKLWKMEMGVDKTFVQGFIQTAAHLWLLRHHRYSAAYRQGLAALEKLAVTLPDNNVYRKFDIEPLVSGMHYNLQTLAPLLTHHEAGEEDIRKLDNSQAIEEVIPADSFLYPKLFEF